VRNNYFPGQLLTADDLARDQKYFRERLRRHNVALGFGVVSGLAIEALPDNDTVKRCDNEGHDRVVERGREIPYFDGP
jgi:hypothetical protein